jgi:UDPglucose 6-dehydrogenase
VTERQTVCVVGLGKLGAPMVACLAEKGFSVIGVDVNLTAVEQINQSQAPVQEPELPQLLERNRQHIRATSSYATAIAQSDITFVIVPTPSDATGSFSLDYVLASIAQIGTALRDRDSFHLVVITSTVMPGATAGPIRHALETASGKQCGVGFGLCYSPEFIALGSVIHDMLNPDFILIGESDSQSGDLLEAAYQKLCNGTPPVSRMNLVNAELAKISVNTFVTTKISYANMLGEICDRIPGADVDVVTNAIGQDARIGKKYLKGATGYGGPCFPRDNVAFSLLAETVGANAAIATATDEVNRRQVTRLTSRLLEHITPSAVVGILGLAYKPQTNVIEESQGVALAKELVSKGYTVVVYDPFAIAETRQMLGDRLVYASSVQDCAQRADALVITTPSAEFKQLAPSDLSSADPSQRKLVLDCWRILNASQFASVCTYLALGVGLAPRF